MKREEFLELAQVKYFNVKSPDELTLALFDDYIKPLSKYVEAQANLPLEAPSGVMIDVRTEAVALFNKIWRDRKKFTLSQAIEEFGMGIPLVSRKSFEPVILEYFVPKFVSIKGVVVGEDEIGTVHEFKTESEDWSVYRKITKEETGVVNDVITKTR